MLDRSRNSSRSNISNIDFENIRQDDQPSNRLQSRSKSPVKNYRDNGPSMPTSITYSPAEIFSNSFTKGHALNNPGALKIRHANSNIELGSKPPSRQQSDPFKKFDANVGLKRGNSSQNATNINDVSKEGGYSFIQPQSLQTICNGNSMMNTMTQSYDKNASSANTFMSGMTSGGMSSSSTCKNCKRLEDNDKILTYSLNQLMNQFNDLIDKERLWRQGNITFEGENFAWNNDDDQSIDSRLLRKTDSGRLFIETKKQFVQVRKIFEELILDVESLSKTNLYKNITLQKENRSPSVSDLNQLAANPGKKLLSSISEARQQVEAMKSAVFSEDIPSGLKDDLWIRNRLTSDEKNTIKTLMLQLEQSKRERRALEIELTIQQRTGGLQNANNVNQNTLRQMIRSIIEEEIKSNTGEKSN